jgi:phosphoribosylamine--glycine ligase
MLVSGGYPNEYEKEKKISGLNEVRQSICFHAGTTEKDNHVYTNGGRVMAITSYGTTLQEAIATSLSNAEKIQYDGKYYRRDIGNDLLKKNNTLC